MFTTLGALAFGLLAGLRHAFEPDHLTAVSTLVTEAGDAKRGALLGAVWGIGHTISLVVVGLVLMLAGAVMPERVAAGFECAVSLMLIALGIRAVVRAMREGPGGPVSTHTHRGTPHTHAGVATHVHVGARTVSWRPLIIGLVHGLAGSGALTALVFAELHGAASRVVYMTLFGLGSVAGMAIASGLAGLSVRALASGRNLRRGLSLASGALAIVVGIVWAVPMVGVLVTS